MTTRQLNLVFPGLILVCVASLAYIAVYRPHSVVEILLIVLAYLSAVAAVSLLGNRIRTYWTMQGWLDQMQEIEAEVKKDYAEDAYAHTTASWVHEKWAAATAAYQAALLQLEKDVNGTHRWLNRDELDTHEVKIFRPLRNAFENLKQTDTEIKTVYKFGPARCKTCKTALRRALNLYTKLTEDGFIIPPDRYYLDTYGTFLIEYYAGGEEMYLAMYEHCPAMTEQFNCFLREMELLRDNQAWIESELLKIPEQIQAVYSAAELLVDQRQKLQSLCGDTYNRYETSALQKLLGEITGKITYIQHLNSLQTGKHQKAFKEFVDTDHALDQVKRWYLGDDHNEPTLTRTLAEQTEARTDLPDLMRIANESLDEIWEYLMNDPTLFVEYSRKWTRYSNRLARIEQQSRQNSNDWSKLADTTQDLLDKVFRLGHLIKPETAEPEPPVEISMQ